MSLPENDFPLFIPSDDYTAYMMGWDRPAPSIELGESPNASREVSIEPCHAVSHCQPVEDVWELGVIQTLAKGQYGRVDRVRLLDDASGVSYACKVPITQALRDKQNFQREIMLLQRIDSPGVLRYYGHGVNQHKEPVLLTSFANMGSLEGLINGHYFELFAPHLKLDMIRDVLTGLRDIHAAKIIHGDIKASNVMVNCCKGTIHAKIGDFGFAKTTDDNGILKTAFCAGTVLFMAPELLIGDSFFRSYDQSVDLYATAFLMYYLLTGTRDEAYAFGNSTETFKQRVFTENRRHDLEAVQPSYMRYVIHQCWSQHPKQRLSAQQALAIMNSETPEAAVTESSESHNDTDTHDAIPPLTF